MCGITGLVDFRQNADLGYILPMNDCLRHRGPNDEGFLIGNIESGFKEEYGGQDSYPDLNLAPMPRKLKGRSHQLALGNRRLAILDISSAGHNPMSFANGKYWLTYNGEVYNYVEIREELKQHGYTFETETDTEVILAAYDHWGVECLSRFNGMWAMAIWDTEKQRLFCSRDRLGIKPFYYFWDGSLFGFASEIKALRQHPRMAGLPEDSVIFDYLVTGSIDHRTETFFDKVLRLPKAHYLLLDLRNRSLHTEQYWQIDVNDELGNIDQIESSKLDEFQQLFTEAVRYRLRSDVPVGTTLSGGLDSSSIVSRVNQLMLNEHAVDRAVIGEKQKTFSAVFDQSAIDERHFLEQVIRQTSVDGYQVQPQGKQGLWSELEKFVYHHDEPVSSTSMYAQWCVMRLASENDITVLLDGQGADEILGGYNYYLGSLLAQRARQGAPLEMLRMARAASPKVNVSTWFLLTLGMYHALPSGIGRAFMGVGDRFFRRNSALGAGTLNQDFARSHNVSKTDSKNAPEPNFSSHLLKSTMRHSLPALLRFEDRNSMAFSIEARVPFLDHRLVEYVYSLPAIYRVQNGWTKWILRETMADELPEEVVWRRGKLGFETPERQWFREGKSWLREYLGKSPLASRHYLKTSAFDWLKSEAEVPGMWRMLNLEIWLRTFFGDQ